MVLRSDLNRNGGYRARCLERRKVVVVLERLPMKSLPGPDAVRRRDTS
jgi:hypothetical protein